MLNKRCFNIFHNMILILVVVFNVPTMHQKAIDEHGKSLCMTGC